MKPFTLLCNVGLLSIVCAPPDVSARTLLLQGERRIEIEEIKAEIHALANKKVRVLLKTTELVEGTMVGVDDSTFRLASGQLSREIAFSDVEAVKAIKERRSFPQVATGVLITGCAAVAIAFLRVFAGH